MTLDVDEFVAACEDYADGWQAADAVLYRLCHEHPRHDHYPTVMAKVAIIGRTYSAGLERHVKLKKGEKKDRLGKATAHIAGRAAKLDGWIARLGPSQGLSPR